MPNLSKIAHKFAHNAGVRNRRMESEIPREPEEKPSVPIRRRMQKRSSVDLDLASNS